jgi:hypothetical protein
VKSRKRTVVKKRSAKRTVSRRKGRSVKRKKRSR